MKRMRWLALPVSLVALLLLLGAGMLMVANADQDYGPRRGYGPHGNMGPGMGYGMGPGMGYGMHDGMGYGMGPGMWPGMMPFWEKVPADKQKQIEQLHRSVGPAMMRKMVEAREQGQELQKIMHTFPVNQNAAEEQWGKLNQIRAEAFKLRMGLIAQMQAILGEELWLNMQKDQRFRPYNRPRE